MRRFIVALILFLALGKVGLAADDHQIGVPTLPGETRTSVAFEDKTVTITFGPIDLPVGHQGDLAASMPKHVFSVPKGMFLTGYKTAAFTKDGELLPREYLHHILMIDPGKKSLSCPGEVYFVAGAGMEMIEAHFPPGYGVKLEQGSKIMAVVAFYHHVPPMKDVMATFTMEVVSEETPLQPMEAYHIGVNVGCYTKLSERARDETDEGIALIPGLQVRSAPIRFALDGCVKFAYPHGHDQLALITLENKTARRTLLRTVPDVALDGTFMGFPSHQVYADSVGFSVNTHDEYEMTMVYHRPLQDVGPRYGMGNYVLYMTRGLCPAASAR